MMLNNISKLSISKIKILKKTILFKISRAACCEKLILPKIN